MKKHNIKKYVSLLLVFSILFSIFTFTSFVSNAASTYNALHVTSAMTIDGNLNESAWNINTSVTKGVTGTPNNTVTFGALWDSNYLYVGVKVLDGNLYNDSTYVWDDDSVEVYIDGNNNHGTTYDSYDRQYIKGYNDSTIFSSQSTTGVLHTWAAISGGYAVEMAIPWSNIGITPAGNMTIGFDIGNNDDDNAGAREGQLMWNGTINNCTDTSAFGDLVLSAQTTGSIYNALHVTSAMTIDGNLNESAWNINKNVTKGVIGTPNNTVTYGALWDSNYLYVGVKVLDGNLYNDSTYPWDDDSVEVYIDGDHNHGTTYDSHDRQYIKGYNDSTIFSYQSTTGVLHAWVAISGGYAVEMAIPWSNIGVTPAGNMTIGFDIGNNDDDNAGARDSQMMWNGTANNNSNTSVFGDLVLSAQTTGPTYNALNVTSAMTIDGNLNESAWNITTSLTKGVIGTPNNTITYGALWNSNYLYVGVKVLDGNLYNDSTYPWDDDSVEVYIDGDHNHGTTYDSHDRQYIKGYNDSTIFSYQSITGVLHAWAAISGGYAVEMAIPWSNIGVTPTGNMTIGFDIGNNDDDNAGARDSQMMWNGTANNNSNTSAFGDLVLSAQTVGATPGIGRVSVSGSDIKVNGTTTQFFGVVDTTALQYAIDAYINGNTSVAGKTSVFNGPDTGPDARIPQNSTPEAFWNQYFALLHYYNCNLVRIGCADTWGTDLQYQAYTNHRAEYFSLLDTMLDNAEEHGVWVVLVFAGVQGEIEYDQNAPYDFGGSGSVFSPGSNAFNSYINYCNDVMSSLEGYNSLGWYDLFNEPDHDKANQYYWHNDKNAFHTWASAVASNTVNQSTHPRTMGVAGLGTLFGWGQTDFNLATGTTGFEIAHRHYYGSASDTYLFSDPETWAQTDGVPLYWGELAKNDVYPLVRWTFGENTIRSSGGQAITSMVLTGTAGYPYTGGTLP